MHKKRFALALLAGLGMSSAAQATLMDRGGGLIHDTDLNITWLADANYAKTSGFNATGAMPSWYAADAWAAGLTYGGYTGWRLPTTLQLDPSCIPPGGTAGYNCTGSEMGHLFYTELGVTAGNSILTSLNPKLALFQNIQSSYYWSDTYGSQTTGQAWFFRMTDGYQIGGGNKLQSNFYAWAVHPGDVAAPGNGSVPEPFTLALVSVGLAGMGWVRRRRGSLGA